MTTGGAVPEGEEREWPITLTLRYDAGGGDVRRWWHEVTVRARSLDAAYALAHARTTVGYGLPDQPRRRRKEGA